MLTRQLLLDRAELDVVAATERIGGLQAQEPASPYIGLWTRLQDFGAGDLDTAIATRAVVKGTLMRATLHLVSAADHRQFWTAVLPMLAAIRHRDRVEPPGAERLRALRDQAAAFTATPRSLGELRDHLGAIDGLTADGVVWWLRRRIPFIHAPTAVAWSFGRRPMLVHADTWLADEGRADGRWPSEHAATEHLVRRYLGAFGPASVADMAQWSGLSIARLRAGVEAVDATGDLAQFRDECGRDLIDLIGAPLPDEDTPAPPRLLPMWDSTILAYADRTRIVSDTDRAVIIARNGDTLPTFTVDGVVAGLWWAEVDRGRTRIVIEPFRPPLASAAAQALEDEADRLAAFVEPLEPAVYARYQRWRHRR